MPELPEVETIRRTLQALVVGKKINDVRIVLPRLVKEPDDVEQFRSRLVGQTITQLRRRGKFLLFDFDKDVLLSHLRMEGRYGVYSQTEPVEKHTHVIFHFTDDSELRYRDVRTFGTMHLYAKGMEEASGSPLTRVGIEPFAEEFTPAYLSGKLNKKSGKIKALLLNQEYVAGLGNIYVDEVLFKAGIHPEQVPTKLTMENWEQLHKSIQSILQQSILLGGSSVKSYVNGQGESGGFQHALQVYGQTGKPCIKCQAPIIKQTIAGRGTHFCPMCQQKIV